MRKNNTDPDPPYRSGHSFETLVGDPDAFSAAVGHVVVALDCLRDIISLALSHGLHLKQEAIPPAVPFAVQVDLLERVIKQTPRDHFTSGDYSPYVRMQQLAHKCRQAEALWRSFLLPDSREDYLRRAVVTAPSMPREPDGEWTEFEERAAATQDAADTITTVAAELDEFLSCNWLGPQRRRRPLAMALMARCRRATPAESAPRGANGAAPASHVHGDSARAPTGRDFEASTELTKAA